jgi:hypothetical protein
MANNDVVFLTLIEGTLKCLANRSITCSHSYLHGHLEFLKIMAETVDVAGVKIGGFVLYGL